MNENKVPTLLARRRFIAGGEGIFPKGFFHRNSFGTMERGGLVYRILNPTISERRLTIQISTKNVPLEVTD